MKNPEENLTKSGFRKHANKLANLVDSLFFFTNNMDDLGIGEKRGEEELANALWKVEEWAKKELEKIELKYLDT